VADQWPGDEPDAGRFRPVRLTGFRVLDGTLHPQERGGVMRAALHGGNMASL